VRCSDRKRLPSAAAMTAIDDNYAALGDRRVARRAGRPRVDTARRLGRFRTARLDWRGNDVRRNNRHD